MTAACSPRQWLGRWLLVVLMLAGCEKPSADVNVNIHGVNYKGDAFSYYVADPARPGSEAGGELVDAFAAGGTTCCFTLPKKWRPGIKVQISTTHWLPKRPDNSLPEMKETHVVEVPRYEDGKPGELWVLRAKDGGMSVISSDVQPDHERWPGSVKGWPEPSLEYRRKRWEILKHHEEGGVRLYTSLLAALDASPEAEATEAWQRKKEHDPDFLVGFSGPDDSRYIAALRQHYKDGLQESHRRLKDVMKVQP